MCAVSVQDKNVSHQNSLSYARMSTRRWFVDVTFLCHASPTRTYAVHASAHVHVQTKILHVHRLCAPVMSSLYMVSQHIHVRRLRMRCRPKICDIHEPRAREHPRIPDKKCTRACHSTARMYMRYAQHMYEKISVCACHMSGVCACTVDQKL